MTTTTPEVALPGGSDTLSVAELATPWGPLRYAACDGTLAAMVFEEGWPRVEHTLERRFPRRPRHARRDRTIEAVMMRYFGGDVDAMDELRVDPGGTDFQRLVWRELRCVHAGTTASYAEIARRIGRPTAVRAVARANATNPVALVQPCHRIIGSDGSLTGYAFGLDRKRRLLEHEGALADSCLPLR
jgi:methylated-DNA-[protein]-cysteine S-methyltransferase